MAGLNQLWRCGEPQLHSDETPYIANGEFGFYQGFFVLPEPDVAIATSPQLAGVAVFSYPKKGMQMNDLPNDLAHPHEDGRERASYFANLIVGGALIALCLALMAVVAFTW